MIADGPPWTATVTAEPLGMQETGLMKLGAVRETEQMSGGYWGRVLLRPLLPTTDETEELRGSIDVPVVRVP